MNKLLMMLIFLSFPCLAQTRVAVIDTGLDLNDSRYKPFLCDSGHKDFTKTGIKDTVGHGTAIVSLILKNTNSKDFCLIIIKAFLTSDQPKLNYRYNILAFEYLQELKPDIVNLSGGGTALNNDLATIKLLKSTHFIVAAGNDDKDISKVKESGFYPASYNQPNMSIVGALGQDGNKLKMSSYGFPNMNWVIGERILVDTPTPNISWYFTGTSVSTAIYTAQYINGLDHNEKSH